MTSLTGDEQFYELVTVHSEHVHADTRWRQHDYVTRICPDCRYIDRSVFPRPIDAVLLKRPARDSLGILFLTDILILSVHFRDQLQVWMTDFTFGKCSLGDGTALSDFVTCYGKHTAVVHGESSTESSPCQTCGMESGLSSDARRFFIRETVRGRSLVQSPGGLLYIHHQVASSIDWEFWPDIELIPIGIREGPSDRSTQT